MTETETSALAADRQAAITRITAPGRRCELRYEKVRGHLVQVFAQRRRTLGESLRASQEFGDREYLVTEHERITYAEHLARVAALSTALRDEYGIGKGDLVAICSANCPEWVLTFWAAINLGAVVVGMNSLWTARELAYGIELTQPALIVADAPRRALLEDTAVAVLSIEDGLAAAQSKYAGSPLPPQPGDLCEDDPAIVLFTSGTTGRPKGATHSHRNVIGAVWYHIYNDAIAAEMGRPMKDRRWLLASPLFHIAGLHALIVSRLEIGDTAVMHLGRFDIDRVLRLIEKERVTNWSAVPTMAARLVERAETQGLDDVDSSSLTTFTFNAAPSSADLKQRIREILPNASRNIGTTYGLTESSTAATYASAAELEADPGTVGRPIPTVELEIRDESGRQVPDGAEGEICLRGPLVMLGYWNNESATSESIGEDGWFRTGDLGRVENDYLYVVSRRSNLILRGGENIYPAEIEYALESHPDVRECIVVGLSHPEWGQEVAAVVVVPDSSHVTAEDLRAHLAERIARYKVPTTWRVTTEELPRNATGKVIRPQVQVR